MANSPLAAIEKIKDWQVQAAKCSPEELVLYEAVDIKESDLFERMFILLRCEGGIREANGTPSDELLFLRESIFSEMLEILAEKTEISEFANSAASARAGLSKSEKAKAHLRLQKYLIENADAKRSKRADRIARASLVQAAITRSQDQTVLADADLERLGEKVAELFPTFRTHDGVRSNWGLRIKAGKASGS